MIRLDPGESISGTCFESGKPAAGKEVSLMLLGSGIHSTLHPETVWIEKVRTDGEGGFAWDDLAPGTYFVGIALQPRDAPEKTRVRRRVTLSSGSAATVTIGDELGEIQLRGRIASPDGEALGGVHVVLEPLFRSKYEQFLTRAQQNGTFHLRRLPRGKYAVRAYRSSDPEKKMADLAPIELTADREISLTAWLPHGE